MIEESGPSVFLPHYSKVSGSLKPYKCDDTEWFPVTVWESLHGFE